MAVEIPAQFYLLVQDIAELRYEPDPQPPTKPAASELAAAAAVLNAARHPLIYAGNGASRAGGLLVDLAEKLGAPVATTIQGKGVFPESHRLWLWNGLGASAPQFVREVASRADALLPPERFG